MFALGAQGQDRINIRIVPPGSKAQGKGDSRNHGLQDPYEYTVF